MNDGEFDRAIKEAKTLEQLYELVQSRTQLLCKGYCGIFCWQGIFFTEAEEANITRYRGAPMPDYSSRMCPLLKTVEGKPESDRCSVHPARPLVCRMWGAAEALPVAIKGPPCPFGCVAEHILSLDEQRAFIERADAIGGGRSAAQEARLARLRERQCKQ